MKDYFEDLVSKSKHVKSFAGYFQRELLTKSENDELPSPYLALFDYELTLSGPEQNTISVRKIGFAVMFKNIDEGSLSDQYKAIDDAEEIVMKFLARIKIDSKKEDHFLYNSFQKENTLCTPVELSQTSFGAEVFLEFKNNQSLKSNPDDWEDDFLSC
ncbi:hypothetical protein [Chryseobacterium terrae]|uniref:Uncharacterized protein n=1 Tax=Chryseobacterium terrae TaxID=3163299 RepID=A0ABW8Y5A5_9FLAO